MLGEELKSEERTLGFLAEQGFLLNISGGWRPSHLMHRKVAYASIPAALRQQLHAKAAEIAIDGESPSALIAYHLYEAGEHQKAVPYLLQAGERALYFLDEQLACRLFSRALQIIPLPPGTYHGDRTPWFQATVGLAQALHDSGEDTQATKLLRHAIHMADKSGWSLQQAHFENMLKELRKFSVHLPQAKPAK
jgi:hypothetical protein